jgi:hypothetical protein
MKRNTQICYKRDEMKRNTQLCYKRYQMRRVKRQDEEMG